MASVGIRSSEIAFRAEAQPIGPDLPRLSGRLGQVAPPVAVVHGRSDLQSDPMEGCRPWFQACVPEAIQKRRKVDPPRWNEPQGRMPVGVSLESTTPWYTLGAWRNGSVELAENLFFCMIEMRKRCKQVCCLVNVSQQQHKFKLFKAAHLIESDCQAGTSAHPGHMLVRSFGTTLPAADLVKSGHEVRVAAGCLLSNPAFTKGKDPARMHARASPIHGAACKLPSTPRQTQ